ncbi:ATP-binding protein [Parvularcula sp. IMCC14364]|uniref:sensor histidine kinase n=1 Tax=Parvularcula sp. IMCC14364 TaxID=3067902 RepID=UPI002740B316|nr:ATP-binding protein [Parvularcula sp. IMCC14364]
MSSSASLPHTDAEKSLATVIIKLVTIIAVSTVVVCAVVCVIALFQSLRGQKIAEITRHVKDRAQSQQEIFNQVTALERKAIDLLTYRLENIPTQRSVTEFDRLFPLQKDGTRRSHPAMFDGFVSGNGEYVHGIGGFVSNGTTISDEEKHLLVSAYHVIKQIGPVIEPYYDNFWFFTPSNQLIIFAPHRPDRLSFYRQTAPADMDFTGQPFEVNSRLENNPTRKMTCTDLTAIMYDDSGHTLTSGCHTPYDINGAFMGAFGISLPLDGWLAEAVTPAVEYATPMLINSAGDLIAHPALLTSSENNLALAEELATDLRLQEIAALVTQNPGAEMQTVGNYYLTFQKIAGPEWTLVMAVDRGYIFSKAINVILPILIFVICATTVGIYLHYKLLRQTVVRPLVRLSVAAQHKSQRGEQTIQSISTRPDELGHLATAIYERDDRFKGLVASLENVVNERTQTLRQREESLKRLNKSLKDFAFVASHDLKTPLRQSEAFIHVLREELESAQTPVSEDAQEALDIIMACSQRMRRLVKSLYDLSSTDTAEIKPTSVDLDRVVAEATDQIRIILQEKDARLSVSPLPHVAGSDGMLTQLFQNLIANACNYAGDSHPVIRIYAGRSDKDICRVIIEDEGTGIAEEFQDKVFEPFKRLVRKEEVEGAGIGLALCRKIAQRHNGDIRLDPDYTKGARFIVELPVAINFLQEGPEGETSLH